MSAMFVVVSALLLNLLWTGVVFARDAVSASPEGAPWWLYGVAVIFLIFFAFLQFNRWTDRELKADDILSAAPPKHFTSFYRFSAMSTLYCFCLLAFYAVLVAIFLHPAWGEGYLKVSGVSAGNAWFAALFAVTGLSSVLPPLTTIEFIVRETLHRWAFVPMKAKALASQISEYAIKFDLDSRHVDKSVPHAGPGFTGADFVSGSLDSIAHKWCRLIYLLTKFAPPAGGGLQQWASNSPYVSKYAEKFQKLHKRVQDMAIANDGTLWESPISTRGLDLADSLDQSLHDLYLLMSCQALGSKYSWAKVQNHFKGVYGNKPVSAG